MMNIETFDSNLLKIDKKSYKNIMFITSDTPQFKNWWLWKCLQRKSFVFLIIGEVDGHIKEKNGSKYLVFDSTNENREALEKYLKLWDGIKNEIETINGGKEGEYGKDFIKTNFDTWLFATK